MDAPLDPSLAAACDAAARAWPDVAVDRAELMAALTARAATTAITDDAAIELALALACARGEPAALAAFDRAYLAAVPAGLAHMKLDPALVADLVQDVRTKLLVAAPGARPRILDYAGHGTLRGLTQVMAARAALDHLRARHRHQPDDDIAALAAAGDDPELAFLKATYRDAFKAAFTAAAADLDARDRNLLRLHHLDGVTLEQLAAMYAVHRATAVRWLADVRKRLLAGTRAHLRTSLSVSADELDSIMALIGSRLDASVRRLLGDGDHGQESVSGARPPGPAPGSAR
ncbi:MAG TPA: sigma-70 family RNA polymerase sigma factor [Kofleriaceae bacterium]|nr:sigma-70 family RNA polymerase sigma factor [Kofleriaceae bacterium]